MKKTIFLLAVVMCLLAGPAFGWGKVGHDAIAYIAECNLTSKAQKNIEGYLGHSIVYDASWMDAYRHTPAYKETSKWHGADVDAADRYAPRATGDAVACIEDAVAKLRNYKELDDSTVVVCIKYLVHLVGDMHCPVHVKYPGVKNFKIYLDGKEYGYHAFWDTSALELNHRWYYMEYQHQLDRCSAKQKRELAAGTPREWFEDNARNCHVIYEWAKPGQRFVKGNARDFINTVHPLAEQQVLKAGYRLAALLNELFG